jgi:diguanylate cyclase (GGDEF)-like protein
MEDEPTKVLVIENNPADLSLVKELLKKARQPSFEVEGADRLSTGLERMAVGGIEVVLLDLFLPDSRGFDTFVEVHAQAPQVPIIVVSASEDEELAAKLVREGAQDYLVRGEFDGHMLVRIIKYGTERKRLLAQLQEQSRGLQTTARRLRTITMENVDGIVVVDRNGATRFANPAAESMFDPNTDEVLGKYFRSPLVTGESVEIEIPAEAQGAAVVEMRVAEAEWDGEKAYLASLRDITRRKRMEEDLKRTTEELRETVVELEESKKVIQEQNNLLSDLSLRDGLTGLYNHRHMDEVLEQEFARAQRYRTDLSCLLMDLDYFKEVNDAFGHAFGDFVLREFSTCLQRHTRISDACFRYGGEEFLVLLPSTDVHGAQEAAEKLRKFYEQNPYCHGTRSVTVTVSTGVASVNYHCPAQARDLVAFADKALYRAKAEGRNRVRVYSEDSLGAIRLNETPSGMSFGYLKQRLCAILEKTKQASLASFELLVRETGPSQFYTHNQQVLACIDRVGNELGFPLNVVDTLKRAAKLHDCFRLVLGETLLTKQEPLTEEERTGIKDHPYMLSELTGLFDFFSNEREALLYHHENYDGTGYPEGLKGDQIPLGARILAIADSFVAMTSERLYRGMPSHEKVVQELADSAGREFDPALVELLLNIIEKKELLSVPAEVFAMAKEKVRESSIAGS